MSTIHTNSGVLISNSINTMKHTDLYNEYKKLDAIERRELIAAVKAHGNEYIFVHFDDDGDFDDEERDYAPIISAATSGMDAYEDFYISRVDVEGDSCTLYGWAKECYADEVQIDSVAHGHLGYVIDSIPETDDIKDVTEIPEELPVAFLSKNDLELVGYSSDISLEDFQMVASTLSNHLDNEDFRASLCEACEYVGLTPLN